MDDTEIRTTLRSLARPHRSGGAVVEHAAILAAGGDSAQIVAWILANDGEAEALAPVASRGGLHGSRLSFGDTPPSTAPVRFLIPAGGLD